MSSTSQQQDKKQSCNGCCLHNNQHEYNFFDKCGEDEDVGIDRLLQYNQKWAEEILTQDPSFFTELAKKQTPDYLWIGCSDSRVPVEKLVGLGPGEVFVHRNVANQVIHTDLNCLSVIQYAVDVLKVKHIIICGHYQCGGVSAAFDNPQLGLINNWILHIRDIYIRYKKQLHELHDRELILDKLVELNLVQQVYNIGNSTILQNAWERGQEVTIHGWIYGLKDGRVKEIDYAANSKQVFEEVHDKVISRLLSQISSQAKNKSIQDILQDKTTNSDNSLTETKDSINESC
ncbi:hypothetical protein ABPG74_005497 [Tetrahymena malaccensis]